MCSLAIIIYAGWRSGMRRPRVEWDLIGLVYEFEEFQVITLIVLCMWINSDVWSFCCAFWHWIIIQSFSRMTKLYLISASSSPPTAFTISAGGVTSEPVQHKLNRRWIKAITMWIADYWIKESRNKKIYHFLHMPDVLCFHALHNASMHMLLEINVSAPLLHLCTIDTNWFH